MHAMEKIAEMGSKPVGGDKAQTEAQAKRLATDADRSAGNTLANECIARVMSEANDWRSYFFRLFSLSLEGRTYFLEALDKWRREQRDANVKLAGVDAKVMQRRMASATVRLSQMATIARALNAGANMEGYCEYIKQQSGQRDNCTEEAARRLVGIHVLVEYAALFSKSAAGRKPDTWLAKMGKYLERNKPAEEDKDGTAQYERFVALYNELVK